MEGNILKFVSFEDTPSGILSVMSLLVCVERSHRNKFDVLSLVNKAKLDHHFRVF